MSNVNRSSGERCEGKYIYCIIDSRAPETFSSGGIGGRGDRVQAVCFDSIAAVVSDSPVMEYRALKENMVTHEKAIEEAMQKHTVLPVRFCTIAESEEKVKKILEKEYDKFKDMLGNMEGKKELGLKAMFKEDVIYKEIIEKYENIRKFKEKIANLPPEKTYSQRMEIGRMVEQALEKEREKSKKEILDNLSPLAEDVKINNTYGERMILNSAFLVNKENEAAFDKKVNELDEKYGYKIIFKYVGTLPPFNFVNLIIKTAEY